MRVRQSTPCSIICCGTAVLVPAGTADLPEGVNGPGEVAVPLLLLEGQALTQGGLVHLAGGGRWGQGAQGRTR